MRGLVWALPVVFVCAPAGAGGTAIVGEEIPRILETPHPYGIVNRSEPQLVWSGTLHDPRATYVAVHFAQLELARGDWVVVRSPDGAQSWRYEGLGRANLGRSAEGFWAGHVRGDTAVVELFATHGSGSFGFVIDRFARGLAAAEIEAANPGINLGFDPELPGPDTICGADDSNWARCYETTEPEIYNQSRAVARLLINGTGKCTGWLIGCDGHLMTNNHCIENALDAANTDYEFMAEGATCATSCAFVGACPGVVEASQATLIQTDAALDYTLVRLPTNITGTYGYLRLRETGPLVNERIYIPQHTAGWGKRIAVSSTDPNDESGFNEVFSLNEPPCLGGPGDVGYFADTQAGSSGAPVLAYSDHRVVSLHHCAACANRGVNVVDVIASLGSNLPPCALGPLAGPPPVPDGSGATEPLRAEPDGPGRIRLTWDAACAAARTNLLYGPLDQVSALAVEGSLCDVTAPQVWDPVPAGDLWFLLVSEDSRAVEGSWGSATSGERNGPTASGECGNDVKDVSGSCP